MRLLTRLSYVVVLFVLALIASIVVPGIGFVLPRVATSPVSWLLHTTISYLLTAGVLFNYFAATFTTPGTVLECCADIPAAFRPQRLGNGDTGSDGGDNRGADGSVSGGGENGGGGGSSSSSRAGGAGRHSPYGSDGEQGSGGSDGERSNGDVRAATALGTSGGDGHSGGSGGGGAAAGGGGRPPAAAAAAALEGVPATSCRAGAMAAAKGGAEGRPDGASSAAAAAAAAADVLPPRQSAPFVPQSAYYHLRYCWPCRGPQTRGSHHCYACGRCVVDQDHHCPFIANCVGRANLRNFISFLAFTLTAMVYTSCMSVTLLLRNREDAAEALSTAAVTAARARDAAVAADAAAAAAGAEGGAHGGLSIGWLVPLTSRTDALVTFILTVVARAPPYITAAAYVLLISLAIFTTLGVLLAQTLTHAVRTGSGVDPAAAQRAARHHLHPASDAAALVEAAEAPGHGGWREALCGLRTIMCGGSDGGGGGGRRSGSAWLWVWPLWGPPPGVLLATAGAAAAADRGQQRRPDRHSGAAAASVGPPLPPQGKSNKAKTQ